MSEPRVGRVLVASLHQAIADVLPMRLEFYENWLSPNGLRDGTIGLAPLSAVLSFLRSEGAAYREITSTAGRYAAEWTVRGLPAMERRLIGVLPARMRARAASFELMRARNDTGWARIMASVPRSFSLDSRS